MKRAQLIARLQQVRQETENLCQPLAVEDYVIQAMADVSPAKWHLAHVSWFFETFILQTFFPGYHSFNSYYQQLFNSYYESLGEYFPRAQRGLLSRPTVQQVYDYRHHIDNHLLELLDKVEEQQLLKFKFVMELGLQHEQQHQELLLMDIKYNLALNPLRPAYNTNKLIDKVKKTQSLWLEFPAGLYQIGYSGQDFAFDNETPRHQVYLNAFKIQDHLVSNQEYLEFMKERGYQKPEYWLSDGWQWVKKELWQAPLYWEKQQGQWWQMTLNGMQPLVLEEPVCHISFYEANAYANWAKARLPAEAEWEVAAEQQPLQGHFLESRLYQPQSQAPFFGELWQWTRSAYAPYPGYQAFPGALAEYNSKFACNQFVLRGGCIITPQSHLRRSYRNFFYPHQRWPFTGIRLARDL